MHVAGRLRDRLAERFGPERVFFDVESVEIGSDFRAAIRVTLSEVDTVLVVIGEAFNLSRLAEEDDVVRLGLDEAVKPRHDRGRWLEDRYLSRALAALRHRLLLVPRPASQDWNGGHYAPNGGEIRGYGLASLRSSSRHAG